MTKKKLAKDYPPYENMDGQLFYDEEQKAFLMAFSDEQKRALLSGMEKKLPIQAIAYPTVPAYCMWTIMENMLPEQTYFAHGNLYRIDYWKVAMIFKDPEDCGYALKAIKYGVDIFKEFKDVRMIEPRVLRLIANGAVYGINICKHVKRGLPYDELVLAAERQLKRHRMKGSISDFFYYLRNPESKDIFK